MSLSAAMQIGRTALSASQLGIATTGNNMANAATPGYRRQLATLTPSKGAGRGLAGSVGLGVAVADIRRQVSISLENRTRGALSDEHASYARQNILGAIETALGELGDNDLSSQLSSFFNAWSERANLVQSSAVVVQEGRSLSSFIQRLRGELTSQRTQLDQELGQASLRASDLIDRIAGLNTAIAQSEVASTTANSLRDQRDALIEELATMVDVSVIERGGSTDILIGSTPVVLDGISRGLTMQRSANGEIRLATRDDGTLLSPKSGAIGSLLAERTGAVDRSINALDSLASNLIHEVNKLHSTSIGDAWLQSSAASLRIPVADRSLALNDPANATLRSLPFAPTNGGFNVNIRNTATGAITTVRVGVDLDGLTAAATPAHPTTPPPKISAARCTPSPASTPPSLPTARSASPQTPASSTHSPTTPQASSPSSVSTPISPAQTPQTSTSPQPSTPTPACSASAHGDPGDSSKTEPHSPSRDSTQSRSPHSVDAHSSPHGETMSPSPPPPLPRLKQKPPPRPSSENPSTANAPPSAASPSTKRPSTSSTFSSNTRPAHASSKSLAN
ncbi:MAG: flagellar hook-associated protein FlgK [Phycisphaeraceae bacterium]|nr:flagellar hook-associated protein FlgK [Phycisphaeraceae bacterium]